jgi:hypothetical protein
MSDDFKQRIATAKERALATQRNQAAAAQAERERKGGVESEAINDWKTRILPLAIQAVQNANEHLQGSGFQLHLKDDIVQVSVRPGSTAPIEPLPALEITIRRESGPGQACIRMGIAPDGKMALQCEYPNSQWPNSRLDRREIDQPSIENVIAIVVDAVLV